MTIDFEDMNGRPRPVEDVAAALQFVTAEMVLNPTRMGPKNTGPATLHYAVIRELLIAELERRR